MKELKPCPFCGEAEDIDYGIYNGTMRGFDYVQCQNCGAEVRALHNCEWIAAEELWNRRTIDAEPTKYRWHDLRKDPNDLPRDMDNVQICWVGGSHYWYDSMFWDAYRGVFSIYGKTEYEVIHPIIGDKRYSRYGQAIAWREIEPFEEEET